MSHASGEFSSVIKYLESTIASGPSSDKKDSRELEALVVTKIMDKPFHLSNSTEAVTGLKRPFKKRRNAKAPAALVSPLTSAVITEDGEQTKRNLCKFSKLAKSKVKPSLFKVKSKILFQEMPQSQRKYALYIPMHELWLSYIGSILTPCQANVGQMLQRLSRGDLNGAILTVKASTCASMTSLSGIVLYECANVFYLITPKDTLKIVPKRGNIFSISWKGLVFYIYGNHWRISPPERMSKKFKLKPTIQLHVDK